MSNVLLGWIEYNATARGDWVVNGTLQLTIGAPEKLPLLEYPNAHTPSRAS